eukprot:3122292-Pyramimonas_sp.AAC.1
MHTRTPDRNVARCRTANAWAPGGKIPSYSSMNSAQQAFLRLCAASAALGCRFSGKAIDSTLGVSGSVDAGTAWEEHKTIPIYV